MGAVKAEDLKGLGENMGDGDELSVLVAEPEKKASKRIRIILDDNDDIPPTGHPVGVNGKMYILKPNEPMDVPEEVVHVLDLAVQSVPVFGADQKVVAFRDRPRLPYRVITAK